MESIRMESGHTLPLLYFRNFPEGEGDVAVREEDAPEEEKAGKLLCVSCGRVITDRSQTISVSGKHRHTFFNPAGLVYELGCFREAPGCTPAGEPSSEFSWFPGYVWQVGACSGCSAHLGWRFQSGDDVFFGLIVSRIVEGDV